MTLEEWTNYAAAGWNAAMAGDDEAALNFWRQADEIAEQVDTFNGYHINPELCLRRFHDGESTGVVGSPIPTEDLVVGLRFQDRWPETTHPEGKMVELVCNVTEQQMRRHFAAIAGLGEPYSISSHLMVMGTGRCGTVSLAALLAKAGYLTYHQCHFNVDTSSIYSQMINIESGLNEGIARRNSDIWLATRRAELIGADESGRPAALTGHLDTIWAPGMVFAADNSRFIYLHRDPVKIFESFYSKGQWSDNQICPIAYTMEPPYEWQRVSMDLPAKIAWYIRYTERFCRAFGSWLEEYDGDRFIEISADKLFAGDVHEIERLRTFAELDISMRDAVKHYERPLNAKLHKINITQPALEAGREAFLKAYENF